MEKYRTSTQKRFYIFAGESRENARMPLYKPPLSTGPFKKWNVFSISLYHKDFFN
ncbi:MAG: hypothetical protein PWQ64_961 [Desulfomicrobiaceae bacterium]|jgi:hypothetical protein|nr:hypothetical protein [Desulfomicrobiaceae bacterium]